MDRGSVITVEQHQGMWWCIIDGIHYPYFTEQQALDAARNPVRTQTVDYGYKSYAHFPRQRSGWSGYRTRDDAGNPT